MRRAWFAVLMLFALAACAAPEFRLASRFASGETREYRVIADAEVTISAADLSTTEHTRLEARTRLVVEQITGLTTTLTMTITPVRLTRDGDAVDPPPEQRVRIELGADGQIDRVTPVEGTGELDAAEIEDLVPLIGPPLPEGRVHLSDRWTRPVAVASGSPVGVQTARLAALRVIDGYDCGIVALSTRRPVVREREIAGTMLRLEGVEYAAGEIAFAFREGFPVSIRSNGEARLAISEGPAAGGGVVIRTTSILTLLRRTVR
ncbi:MAG: hypothetical protein ACRDJ1_10550 [Actinomycetota bacterium]